MSLKREVSTSAEQREPKRASVALAELLEPPSWLPCAIIELLLASRLDLQARHLSPSATPPCTAGLTTPRARQETDAEDMFDCACDQLKEMYEWGIRSRKALHQYQGFEDASACYASTWGKFQLADPAKFSRVTTRSPPPVGFPGDFFRLAG